MKRFFIITSIIIVTSFFSMIYANGTNQNTEMLVKIQSPVTSIQDLEQSGLYIYEIKDGYITGAVTEEELKNISDKGYHCEILIPDMVKYQEALAPGTDFGRFHSYQEIVDTFNLIAQSNPDLVRLDTIGYSVQNRVLLSMKITSNPGTDEHKPRILWDATTHGNENIGSEVCLYLVRHLLVNYGVDPKITNLVNSREIWIIPITNPDGMVLRQRENANGTDLNRDYGYVWDTGWGSPGPFSQPEILAIRNFTQRASFVMWTSYHSGAEAAMWPWGYRTNAPYDSIFLSFLCQRYSYHTGLPAFQICRGLYETHGASADYGYGAEGALLICPELCSPWVPDTSRIEPLCQANLNANLELISRCAFGIRGRVYDSLTNEPIRAIVEMQPPYFPIYTDSLGYYFRYALQGNYSLKIIANGYAEKIISNIQVPADSYTICDIPLKPDTTSPTFAYKCVSSDIKDPSDHSNTSLTIFALGRNDNRRFSLGVKGWAAFDMQKPIINGPGSDFMVYENDGDPEACSVYVSENWNGPWHFCGVDTGNSSFDLSHAGVGMARYVRIADDGDGTNGPTGGFDLDAIEAIVVNAPALAVNSQIIYDNAGNNNGIFDPGETIELVINLTNFGRLPALSVTGTLNENDQYIEISDSTGIFGDILPDSTRNNDVDRFILTANANTPTEHVAQFVLHLNGTGYQDSVQFSIRIGEFTTTDPIPDGPREPPLYWAYDDVDSFYTNHPNYDWVEINTVGSRLSYPQNDEVRLVDLPTVFGPWRFYGNRNTQISISADGWIAAGSNTDPAYLNTGIPDPTSPNGIVALNWDDLYPNNSGSGGIYWSHDAFNHRLIVEYDSVPYYNPTTIMDKFELIIYDTTVISATGDNILISQYQTANRFTSSTVGIEDPTGSIGIQCLYNDTRHRGCSPIAPEKAIKYTTDAPAAAIGAETSASLEKIFTVSPNPFRTTTIIRIPFAASANKPSGVRIYDIAGKLVKTFNLTINNQKLITIYWDGKDKNSKKLASGVYIVRLESAQSGLLKKVILMR